MDVGAALVGRARAMGCHSIAVVGTGKNVGKTVTVAAVCAALQQEGSPFALVSIGRDGEGIDSLEGTVKPALVLRPGALLATAQSLLPRHPATEVLAVTAERSALGNIVLARVRAPGSYQIVGPSSAPALRRVVHAFAQYGAPFLVIDGAVDRTAALAQGNDAIVVATGAAAGATQEQVVDGARALVARLSLPAVDFELPMVHIDGALTAPEASELVRRGERRQVVVRDPTRVMVGAAFAALAAMLDLRCEYTLRPMAATIASIGPQHRFEPRAFLHAVAQGTHLPTYDVYAQAAA